MTGAFDVIIVGAGPAGLAAAIATTEAGRQVCILDDNPAAGGQIWRGFDPANIADYPGSSALSHVNNRLRNSNMETRFGARVVDHPASGVLRVETESGHSDFAFQRLIVATGARERFLPFPGWTLPGVTGAGGLQAIVKSGLPIAGKRVVVAGSGPLLPAVAAGLAKHGARIVGIFEQASLARLARFTMSLAAHPAKIWEGLRYRSAMQSAPYRTGSWVVRAHGSDRLRAVTVNIAGAHRELECDYLACGFHLVPNLELPRLLGCATEGGYVRVDASQQSSVECVYCVGELTGIGGLEKALCEGEIAGLACAGKSLAHLFSRRNRLSRFARQLDSAFALRLELTQLADADTFICRCEDVPRRALEPCRNWREAKLYTRCGMGPCQGRVCGPAVETIFGWENSTVRPPLIPARVETIAAAHKAGQHS
jgi:NADPH-dependent 2,4-dienoyl-CoA reductase/sulfur reductase-like enzyme